MTKILSVYFTDNTMTVYKNARVYTHKGTKYISIVEGDKSTLIDKHTIRGIENKVGPLNLRYEHDKDHNRHIVIYDDNEREFDTQEEAFDFIVKLGM